MVYLFQGPYFWNAFPMETKMCKLINMLKGQLRSQMFMKYV